MSELTLHNLDERLLQRLQESAAAHGITMEEEAKKILHVIIDYPTPKTVLERTRAIRARNAHLQKTDTLSLLREDRDCR